MPAKVLRFGKTTRWLHWTFALSFLALASTGGLLFLREWLGLAQATVEDLITLHKTFVWGLLVIPAVVWLSGSTRDTGRDLREVVRWTPGDLQWLASQPRALLGRAELPPAGKLNAGQKVNALSIAFVTAGLALSGGLLWRDPTALFAWAIHLGLFLVWLPLFAGHLFLALVNPGTRPALRGITLGEVDRAWAAHHHAEWVAEPAPREGSSGTRNADRERTRRVRSANGAPGSRLLQEAGSLADGEV